MKKTWLSLMGLLPLVALVGCGSGGSSSGGSNGYLFGQDSGAAVYMQPAPPAYTFTPWSGTSPGIRIDQVVQFSSTVNPTGASIYQGTTQVVFGQITGPISGVHVCLYSYTNEYYIQPLTSTTININSDSTWIAPANAGSVTALLIRTGYSPPAVTATLPAVDGVNVLAVATQP